MVAFALLLPLSACACELGSFGIEQYLAHSKAALQSEPYMVAPLNNIKFFRISPFVYLFKKTQLVNLRKASSMEHQILSEVVKLLNSFLSVFTPGLITWPAIKKQKLK